MAYVRFAKPSEALVAYEETDGKDFQGRLLHVLPANDTGGNSTQSTEPGRKKTLKETIHEQRKETAGKDFNWAMLYMNVRPSLLLTNQYLTQHHRVMPWCRQLRIACKCQNPTF